MKHVLIATGNTKVNMEAVESVLYQMDEAKKRANDYRAKGQFDLYDMDAEFYLGMKLAMERLGLIEKKDVEF